MIDVTITSAKTLSKTELSAVEKLVNKRGLTDYQITQVVKPEILGGFVLQLGHEEIDASVVAKLRAMKHGLLKT